MDFTVSAPGKVILFGEHAVVYGATAVCCAADLRTVGNFHVHDDGDVVLTVNAMDKTYTLNRNDMVDILRGSTVYSGDVMMMMVMAVYLKAYRLIAESDDRIRTIRIPCIHISLKSQIPVGAGLGSSASMCAVVACGVIAVYHSLVNDGRRLDIVAYRESINIAAYEGERVAHGSPSGVDNTTVVYGGTVQFKSGKFSMINLLPKHFLIVDSRIPRKTKEMVSNVKNLKLVMPLVIDPIMQAIDGISRTFLDNPDADVSCLIRINQQLLSAIGVSHPKFDNIIEMCTAYSLSFKLTGAGGGGCGIIYIPDGYDGDVKTLISDLTCIYHVTVLDTLLGVDGVRYET